MTVRLIAVIAALAFAPIVMADVGDTNGSDEVTTPSAELSGPELWFPVGESLVYNIYWGVIPVGTTEITTEWIEEGGRILLAIRYRTRSNSVIATLYPVDDRIESIIDPETFLSVRFTKNLKEGRHRYHEQTTFDYANGVAHWKSFIKNTSKTYPIESDTRDLVTFMYYMRSQTFEAGTTKTYRVMADEKIYELILECEENERVALDDYGKVPSLRMEPKAKFEGLFVRSGRMKMWVSTDPRALCTRVKAKVPVANINVLLEKVRGPGDDFWRKP
ncbi:MAG: DUF3108 domain-containing protein [Verrucomicrobia bacterium]|nr:DUF3108 domain-containing protein [Verrucomicrobiota bacterium]